METAFHNTPAEPVWRTISLAVKAGQTHPEAQSLRDALARILDVTVTPPVHTGAARVLERLRSKDRALLRRLLDDPLKAPSRLLLGGLFIERGWMRYEKDRARGAARTINAIVEAYVAEHSTEALAGNVFAAEAWEGLGYIVQFYGNTKTPDEMCSNGVRVQVQRMTEWLRVLLPTYQAESVPSERTEDDLRAIAERSVPPLAHAYSAMGMGYFEQAVLLTAKPDPRVRGRHQPPSTVQDPTQYELGVDQRGERILTLAAGCRARIPAIITGLGCPAKYAHADGGGNVVGALGTMIMDRWREEALPLALEEGTVTPSSMGRYTEALRLLNS